MLAHQRPGRWEQRQVGQAGESPAAALAACAVGETPGLVEKRPRAHPHTRCRLGHLQALRLWSASGGWKDKEPGDVGA